MIYLDNVLQPINKKNIYPYINQESAAINNLLISYGLTIDNVIQGASVIQYKATMHPSVNVNKLMKLESNIRIALNCDNAQVIIKGNQFIVQKPCTRTNVVLKEFYNNTFLNADGLKLILGTDIEGHHIYTDLAKQPHMLVAGTTGSGKSMFLHQCIISLLMKNPTIELYAIDSKQVEFNAYSSIPNFHNITDEASAAQTLKRLVDIMEGRYKTFSDKGYRDITDANRNGLNIKPIVCIIDEFADLMMKSELTKAIESYVVRLAQKSRAAGIHLIIATQRPTSDVITGLIKANIPSRVCLHVNSAMESRIVMDMKGGEYLFGHGDMYFKGNGSNEPIRLQSCFISSAEMQMIGNAIAKYNTKSEPIKTHTASQEYTQSKSRFAEYDVYENEIIRKRKERYHRETSWIDRLFNR